MGCCHFSIRMSKIECQWSRTLDTWNSIQFHCCVCARAHTYTHTHGTAHTYSKRHAQSDGGTLSRSYHFSSLLESQACWLVLSRAPMNLGLGALPGHRNMFTYNWNRLDVPCCGYPWISHQPQETLHTWLVNRPECCTQFLSTHIQPPAWLTFWPCFRPLSFYPIVPALWKGDGYLVPLFASSV